MAMTLEAHPQQSDQDETCWRCLCLGLPPDGIPAGALYIAFVTEGADDPEPVNCCIDCWERLQAEIDKEA